MSMAMKYAMKKKMAKGGSSCVGSECQGCSSPQCYAAGGFTEGGVHTPVHGSSTDPKKERGSGMSRAGEHVRGIEGAKERGMHKAAAHRLESAKKLHEQNLSELKSMKKPNLYADGGEVEPPKPPVDPERAKKAEESMRKAFGYSDGGEADEGSDFSDDMVNRIMKHRFSKGEEEPVADFESNDFDYLDQIGGDHEADYDEENSGDDIGNEAEDEDQHDVVKRIMKSRSKKDKMPRPA